MLLNTLPREFDFKRVILFPLLSGHALKEDFLLLPLFILSHNSVDELVVLRVAWSHSTE